MHDPTTPKTTEMRQERTRFYHLVRPVVHLVTRRAPLVVLVAVLLSVGGFILAQQLRIDTDFSKLIPSNYPSVQALERLREMVGSETTADIAIRSPSFEANRAFAEDFIPRALELKWPQTGEPYLQRVDYRKDTAFLEENALYFATDAELDSLEAYIQEEIRSAKLEANPFFFDLDLEEEEDAQEAAFSLERDLQAVYDQVIGKEYPINEDSTVMVLRFYPTGSQTNISFIEGLYEDLDALVDEMNPESYHPEMEVILAGRLYRQLVEVTSITRDVFGSFAAGVSTVLLMVVLYFFYKAYTARAGHRYDARVLFAQIARTPVLAALIGVPLLMSLTWTFGLAYLVFETLNLMTSTLGLVLFGLGIDYGIHYYARYTEERGKGHTPDQATERTLTSTGQAIAVGCMTTAVALFVLMIADFKGFSEFGFIAGTGVLLALIAMTVVLPALLLIFERYRLLNFDTREIAPSPATDRSKPISRSRGIVLASVAAAVAALVLLPRVEFEYQFGNLEPEYSEYEARRAVVRTVYPGRGANPAYVLVDDPSEVRAVVEAVEEHIAKDTLTPTIDRVESLQDRFPMEPDAQQRKLARIADIRALLNDPLIQAEGGPEIERIRHAAQTTRPIDIDDIPESIRNQFTSKTGEVGNFVMIYPAVGLSDGRNSMAFADDVGTIVTAEGKVYHAGSTSLVAADMLRLLLKEAPYMVVITFVIVILLMWINFGSIRWAALATVPLVMGVLWMILLMELLNLKLNFYNIVVLPAVLGIGNDAGVHLVHRYREEGRGTIRRVLRSTGEHITMASLTTMVGFAGLLLSFHPGLKSIGELAVVGIGMTLLAALAFHPALLQWLEDRRSGALPMEGSVEQEPALLEDRG